MTGALVGLIGCQASTPSGTGTRKTTTVSPPPATHTEMPKEPVKEPSKEMKEAPKEPAKEAPKEAPKAAPKTGEKEVPPKS
jgi:hypothetical protein